jgi:erythromycin esterase-like protein
MEAYRCFAPYAENPQEYAARQNAEVLAGAEAYYRAMARGGPESWNIRDCHMADTLDRLMVHHGPRAKAVVWEHNTHISDARATDMAQVGMVRNSATTCASRSVPARPSTAFYISLPRPPGQQAHRRGAGADPRR